MAKVAAILGRPLMPWQRYVADVGGEVDEYGHHVYPFVIVTVQRQAGKTTVMRPLGVHATMTRPDMASWLTAQKRNDARDIWSDTVKLAERSPLGSALKVRRTNGSESLTFKPTGGELRIFAPSEDALHGKTTPLVMIDEGWAFTQEKGDLLMQAITPTQITVPGAQTWLFSTAGTKRSTWLRGYVDTAREALAEGRDPGFAYFEWGLPPGADLADLDAYAAAHPAFGHTITMDGLRRAQSTMTNPAAFARAYGNRWTETDAYLLDLAVWERARTTAPLALEEIALCAEVSLDRSSAVIVAAGWLAPGLAALEVLQAEPGTAWVKRRLLELARDHKVTAIALDPHGPARSVLTELARARARVPVLSIDTGQYVEAWGDLQDGLEAGSVAHRSHHLLDAAVASATGRTVREQIVISREGATCLVAGMLALYGLRNPPSTGPKPVVAS